MAGKLRLLSVGRATDGQVEGVFEIVREGNQAGKQITERFSPNATQSDVVNQLARRCAAEANYEPAPAQLLLEKLFDGGEPRTIPDPPA